MAGSLKNRKQIFLLTLIFACSLWAPSWSAESAGVSEQIEKGDAYLNEDQFDRAVTAYRKAVSSNPKNAAAHQRLGKALSLAGDMSGAEREMRKAILLDPNDGLAHSNLGMILGMQKRFSEVVAEERKAIQLDAEDALAYRTMGNALSSLGQYEAAIRAFQKGIELEPYNVNAYLNLGATLGRMGDFSNAIEAYRAVLKLKPSSVAAHIGLGAALGRSGDLPGQIGEYKVAVALAPGSDTAHGRLGYALARNNDWQGALREGATANWIRLIKHGPEYLQFFVSLWGALFLVFGLFFAALIFGSKFETTPDEKVLKSYFLTLYNDRPGRFAITNKRLVFAPEMFSRSFGASTVSLNKRDILTIESKSAGAGALVILEMKDGTQHQFRIPVLVVRPLMEALSELTAPVPTPVTAPSAANAAASHSISRMKRITMEIVIDPEEFARRAATRKQEKKDSPEA